MNIFPTELYRAENELAYYINKLNSRKTQAIEPNVEGLLHLQPQAVHNACTKSLSILTGPAGTGKTTTLKSIIASFVKAGLYGKIFCPTGKASKRADEVVNEGGKFNIECSTIQSGLEFTPEIGGYRYSRHNKLDVDYVVLDEFSMGDVLTMRDLFEAIGPETRVVLSGDHHQLPSVAAGAVARDLIECEKIPTICLDKILRTGERSGISYNANLVLKGMDVADGDESGTKFTDFFFVKKPNEESTFKTIMDYICEKIPARRGFNPLKDIQLISPGKKSTVGTYQFNKELRDALNPEGKENKLGFKKGDKVINTKNNKKLNVVNGDVGFVVGATAHGFEVDFGFGTGKNKDGKLEVDDKLASELGIQLSYASTTHRSQGSQYPVVLMPIHRCHMMLLFRNLIYTGGTRAQQLHIFVGDYEAFRSGVKNCSVQKRRTGLQQRLR